MTVKRSRLAELRKKAEYYIHFDTPSSWYRRNPHDASISIHWKELLDILDLADEAVSLKFEKQKNWLARQDWSRGNK